MNRTQKTRRCKGRIRRRKANEAPNAVFYRTSWYLFSTVNGKQERHYITEGTPAEREQWKAGMNNAAIRKASTAERLNEVQSLLLESWNALRSNQPTTCSTRPQTVGELIDRYVAFSEGNGLAASTMQKRKADLQSFRSFSGAVTGNRRVESLAIMSLNEEIAQRWAIESGWGDSRRKTALVQISCLCNWGVANRLIDFSPVGRMKLPKARKREHVFSSDELAAIRRLATPEFREFFDCVLGTWRRPSEIASLTAESVEATPDGVILTLEHHKNRSKTGKAEYVFCGSALSEAILARLAANPTGHLFRRHDGERWTKQTIGTEWRRIRRQLVSEGVISKSDASNGDFVPYNARHTAIATAVDAGVPLPDIAAQCGNSVLTLHQSYLHAEKATRQKRFAIVNRVV